MTESETYWLSFVNDLIDVTQPLRDEFELEEEPAWVTKLTCELFNMIAPKIQFRVGKGRFGIRKSASCVSN